MRVNGAYHDPEQDGLPDYGFRPCGEWCKRFRAFECPTCGGTLGWCDDLDEPATMGEECENWED